MNFGLDIPFKGTPGLAKMLKVFKGQSRKLNTRGMCADIFLLT